MKRKLNKHTLAALVAGATIISAIQAVAADIAGYVQAAGSPIAEATVTLYAAGEGAPRQLAQGKTDADGAFNLNADQVPPDSLLYVIAKGDRAASGAGHGVAENRHGE
jgi:hypothetical protein